MKSNKHDDMCPCTRFRSQDEFCTCGAVERAEIVADASKNFAEHLRRINSATDAEIDEAVSALRTPSPQTKMVGPDGLNENAFEAARKAYHQTHLGEYGTLRAAISAYLVAAQRSASHALRLAEGRLSLLLEAYPDESDTIDHPVATRYVLEQVRAALTTEGQP